MEKQAISVTVNGVRWTHAENRSEIACVVCRQPTKGRIGDQAICLDDGMAHLLKPIAAIREQFKILTGAP